MALTSKNLLKPSRVITGYREGKIVKTYRDGRQEILDDFGLKRSGSEMERLKK